MSKGSRLAAWIGFALLLLYVVWWLEFRTDGMLSIWGFEVLPDLASLYASVVLFSAYRQSKARHWLYYAGGAFCFFLAHFYDTVELLMGIEAHRFGPAEALWVMQSVLYIFALFHQNRSGRHLVLTFILDISLFTTVFIALYWQLFMYEAVGSAHVPSMVVGFHMLCASVNLVILISLLFLFIANRSRVPRAASYWLVAAFLAKTAGSSLAWVLQERDAWDSVWGGIPDFCWVLGMLSLGFAGAYGRFKRRIHTGSKSRYVDLKRYLPVGLGGLLLITLLSGSMPFSPLQYGSLLGVVLLIARLFLGIRESEAVNRALRQSNSNYRNWVDNALVGVFIEQEGKLAYVNRHCEEIFGYPPGEMLGTTLLGHLPVGDIARFLTEADRLRKNIPTSRFDIAGNKRDKSPLELEMQLAMTVYQGKEALSGTLIDITERKMSEQWLIRSEKLSVVGQLAAGVAHEIRNPLTALKGFTQLLIENSTDHRNYYEIMLTELERINYIVGEFMVLSKPHNRQQLKEQDIHRVFTSIIPILESEANLHNVIIDIQQRTNLPRVRCDENQIKQVLINLMKNAIEAMPAGGTVTVRYETDLAKRQIIVYIEDQGAGIPADLLDRLGEPFLTTKEKGTGLGLMVCYKIIEAHEGTLSITSNSGQGTVVKIMLPAR